MTPLLLFHSLCASRGDGLLPEFVALLERPTIEDMVEIELARLPTRHGGEAATVASNQAPPAPVLTKRQPCRIPR